MAIIDNTFDLLCDESNELQADSNGDFVTGDCSNNYIYYIAASHTGHYKQFPLVGIGIDSRLNSSVNPQLLTRDILAQLKSDIFTNPSIDATQWPNEIKINNIVVKRDAQNLNS